MLIDWYDLELKESLEELREGFSMLDNRKLQETMVAVILAEFDLSLNEVVRIRNRIIDIPGDILDRVDTETGEVSLE